MNPIDWPTLFNQAPSIAIAVAFGFFILRLLDRQDKQIATFNSNAAAERQQRQERNESERKQRDESWQKFLAEERDARTTWITAASNQLTQLAQLVSATNTLITQHDTWERATASAGQQRRKDDNQ